MCFATLIIHTLYFPTVQYKPPFSMAEFADFGGSAAPASTDDPAAEFLAREQSALGDLDEDFAFNKDAPANSNAGMTNMFARLGPSKSLLLL